MSSYSPDKHKELIDKELEKLHKDLSICREVAATLSSKGWSATIAPIIDKMIIDIVGGKIGDKWCSGKLDKAKKDEMREFYIGYKQAMIEFHERVTQHVRHIEILEKQIALKIEERSKGMRLPLVEDTRYGPES